MPRLLRPASYLPACSVLLSIFAMLAAHGCSRVSKTPSDTLIIGIENEIANLDLRSSADANSSHIAKLVLQGLLKIGDDLRPELDLASQVTTTGDREFRFKIPANITFHDGTPLTAEDVLYNFRQASGPQSKVKSSFADVLSFAAPDAGTFIIKLNKPNPSFLASDVSAIKISPKHLGESPELGRHPVGSGPYKFVARHFRDLIFERFENYHSQDPHDLHKFPTFKKIIVRTVGDPTTRFFSIIGGDLDVLINALSPRRVTEAAQDEGIQTIRSPGSTYQYLGLNLKNEKLRDPRVREALSLAIDRQTIITHKLKGFATPANSVLSPQNIFTNRELPEMGYDPVRARKLLSEAGASHLSLEIRCSADRDAVSILQVIQEQWRQVGVETRLKSTEFSDFFSSVQKGEFEVFMLRWTAVTEPDLLNRIFHSRETPPGRNRVFYSNPVVDKLLDQAASEVRLPERQKLYRQIQTHIARDFPYISLWYPDNVAVATKALKDFRINPTGSWAHLFYAKKEARDGRP